MHSGPANCLKIVVVCRGATVGSVGRCGSGGRPGSRVPLGQRRHRVRLLSGLPGRADHHSRIGSHGRHWRLPGETRQTLRATRGSTYHLDGLRRPQQAAW